MFFKKIVNVFIILTLFFASNRCMQAKELSKDSDNSLIVTLKVDQDAYLGKLTQVNEFIKEAFIPKHKYTLKLGFDSKNGVRLEMVDFRISIEPDSNIEIINYIDNGDLNKSKVEIYSNKDFLVTDTSNESYHTKTIWLKTTSLLNNFAKITGYVIE